MIRSLIVFLTITLSFNSYAALVKSDFLTTGDGLLVTDDISNLEWLSPTLTANNAYDSALVQSIKSNYGFEYASASQVLQMIASNFGTISTVFPGDISSGNAAKNYLDIFGINQDIDCVRNRQRFDCPRTSAFTGTEGIAPGTQVVLGLLQYGDTGFMINYNGVVTQTQQQVGSWLVRSGPVEASVSAPASFLFIVFGSICILINRRVSIRSQ